MRAHNFGALQYEWLNDTLRVYLEREHMFQGLKLEPFKLPDEAESIRQEVREFLARELDPAHSQTQISMQANLPNSVEN